MVSPITKARVSMELSIQKEKSYLKKNTIKLPKTRMEYLLSPKIKNSV